MTEQTTGAAAETVEAVWRLESTRLIAGLVRIVREVGLAEDLAQDALVAALDQWPRDGIPDNPGAWLMTTARRRAVDGFRRRERRDRAYQSVAHDIGGQMSEQDLLAAVDHVEDDVLRLMFICCHPSLSSGGADHPHLAAGRRADGAGDRPRLPTTEATIAQRLVRAKRTLADARAALEEPSPTERAERLDAVQAVVYLLFNEGYSATAGPDWTRPTLCREALRVGRILTALVPDDPEVGGLRALMELQSSRLAARAGPDGAPILLPDQDRRRWDTGQIARGLAALTRAEQLCQGEPGPYLLQAGIAACHARARTAADTDWVRITSLYEQLARQTGSAVVEVNRAVALSMAYGPAAGLTLLDQLVELPALRDYHLLPSVRGDLLERLGRWDEARAEFERAATLTDNEQERNLLLDRARQVTTPDA